MVKTIQENRKILRRYIRVLSRYPGMLGSKDAIKYFIVVHNYLGVEELFYDQCLIADKQINNHLFLASKVDYCSTILAYYRELYKHTNDVRFSIETMDSIEEVRLFLASDECKNIHSRLIMEWEDIKSKKEK